MITALFRTLFLFVCLFLFGGAGSIFAGAKAELWERWTLFDADSAEKIDHEPLQNFLNTYRIVDTADNVAKIRYADVTPSDRTALGRYIQYLENSNVDSLNPDEQFAFWVNLYNAATVQLILREYPVESIRRISEPWDEKLLMVAGENISLNDIEHRILRPRWKDPRIHFVVNCASIGCPDIPAKVLTAENSETILEQATFTYLNHPRGVSLRGRNLVISSIFNWYAEDFGDEKAAILNYISSYRDLADLLERQDVSDAPVRYDYDWSLNDPP